MLFRSGRMIPEDRYGYILSMPFPEMVEELKKDKQEAIAFLIQYQLVSGYDRKKEILSTLCQALDIEINFIKTQAEIERAIQQTEKDELPSIYEHSKFLNQCSVVEGPEINRFKKLTDENDDVIDHFVKTGKWIGPENNGGSTNYYKIKSEWKDVQDVIEERNMNFAQGNILKAAWCLGTTRHKGTNYERELNKIIWFCERELARLKLTSLDKTEDFFKRYGR